MTFYLSDDPMKQAITDIIKTSKFRYVDLEATFLLN